MNKFVTRTLSGAVYVLIVVGAIYAGRWMDNALAGNILFASVFLIIGIIGIYEYINNISKRGIRCNRPMAYIAGVIVYLATVFPLLQNSLWPVEQLKTMGVLLNVGIIIGCLAPILYLTTPTLLEAIGGLLDNRMFFLDLLLERFREFRPINNIDTERKPTFDKSLLDRSHVVEGNRRIRNDHQFQFRIRGQINTRNTCPVSPNFKPLKMESKYPLYGFQLI